MTFDEAFKPEAEYLFDTKADLEIHTGSGWEWLANEPLRCEVFKDKSRACQLASPSGIKLSNGMSIRFKK